MLKLEWASLSQALSVRRAPVFISATTLVQDYLVLNGE